MSGCVPIPFLSPPMRTSFLPGVMGGEVHIKEGTESVEGATPYLAGRFAAHPLALVRSLAERSADFGVGYLIEGTVVSSEGYALAQGPYLEVAYHPWQQHWKSGHFARAIVFVTGDLLFDTQVDDRIGGGMTGGVGIEWGQWVSDPFVSQDDGPKLSAVLGYAHGEGTIGAQLVGGFRVIGDEEWWLVSFGLTFRVPATLGVWVIELDP